MSAPRTLLAGVLLALATLGAAPPAAADEAPARDAPSPAAAAPSASSASAPRPLALPPPSFESPFFSDADILGRPRPYFRIESLRARYTHYDQRGRGYQSRGGPPGVVAAPNRARAMSSLTGWWTLHGARDAEAWLATDLNPETLAVARSKPMPASVQFAEVDAYSFEQILGQTFNGAFAGCWWSHVPLAQLPGWLESLHARLEPGARVVMLDTQFRMHPTLGDFVSKNFYESVGLGRVESGRKPEEFAPTVPGFGAVACAWIDVPARLGREEKASSSRQRIQVIEDEMQALEVEP